MLSFILLFALAFLILEENTVIMSETSFISWKWIPDAIVFNSWQEYGTPSYWMQTFFRESSSAEFHPVKVTSRYSDSLAASAIIWRDTDNSFLRVKVKPTDPSPCSLCVVASTHFTTTVI
jgi:hypothetical protein